MPRSKQCCTTFRTRGLVERVRCSLPKGHLNRYHQHDFGDWVARVWPTAQGVKFRYFAKLGKVLPEDLKA